MSRPNWNLKRSRWRRVRQLALIRDQYRCRNCGGAGRLECHHVVPVGVCADPYHLDNIRVLCRGCHIRLHPRRRERTYLSAEHRRWQDLIREST